MKFTWSALIFTVALSLGAASAGVAQVAPGQAPPTPPVPPKPNAAGTAAPATVPPAIPIPPPSAVPTVAPTASPKPRKARPTLPPEPGPSGTPAGTPAPPQFATLDGVWEVQVQPYSGSPVTYDHFYITQKADGLSGTWVRANKQKLPFTGTFDGRQFKLSALDGTTTVVLAGYEDNFSDMVDTIDFGASAKFGTAFTASHRKRDKQIL